MCARCSSPGGARVPRFTWLLCCPQTPVASAGSPYACPGPQALPRPACGAPWRPPLPSPVQRTARCSPQGWHCHSPRATWPDAGMGWALRAPAHLRSGEVRVGEESGHLLVRQHGQHLPLGLAEQVEGVVRADPSGAGPPALQALVVPHVSQLQDLLPEACRDLWTGPANSTLAPKAVPRLLLAYRLDIVC